MLEESSDEEGGSSSENEEEDDVAGVETVRREIMAMQQEDCSMCKDCFHLCIKSVAAVAYAEDVYAVQFDIASDWEGSLIARICRAI